MVRTLLHPLLSEVCSQSDVEDAEGEAGDGDSGVIRRDGQASQM